MINNRETIIAAILAKLSTLPGFGTPGREWQGVNNSLTTDNLPASYLIETGERQTKKYHGMPSKIDWKFDLVLVMAKPPDTIAAEIYNPILDTLDTFFEPSPGEKAAGVTGNLGGLVEDIWIEGEILKNSAFLGGAACLAVIPIHVRNLTAS
jgi:hypothetical protein